MGQMRATDSLGGTTLNPQPARPWLTLGAQGPEQAHQVGAARHVCVQHPERYPSGNAVSAWVRRGQDRHGGGHPVAGRLHCVRAVLRWCLARAPPPALCAPRFPRSFFSLLLIIFEFHIPSLDRAVRRYFGFLFNYTGRVAYVVLCVPRAPCSGAPRRGRLLTRGSAPSCRVASVRWPSRAAGAWAT